MLSPRTPRLASDLRDRWNCESSQSHLGQELSQTSIRPLGAGDSNQKGELKHSPSSASRVHAQNAAALQLNALRAARDQLHCGSSRLQASLRTPVQLRRPGGTSSVESGRGAEEREWRLAEAQGRLAAAEVGWAAAEEACRHDSVPAVSTVQHPSYIRCVPYRY